jgi:hypothetical protein
MRKLMPSGAHRRAMRNSCSGDEASVVYWNEDSQSTGLERSL